MGQFTSFWWLVLRRALRGSGTFANNWQTLGAFGVGLLLWLFRINVIAVNALGGLMLPLAMAGAAWLIFFICRFLFWAPYRCFSDKSMVADASQVEVERLTAKLTPRIACRYDPHNQQCRATPVWSDGRLGRSFRLEIENLGEENIEECQGYLIEPAELGAMRLTWAEVIQETNDAIRLSKWPKRYLNVVAVIDQVGVKIEKSGPEWPIDKTALFLYPGTYRLAVIITGKGCPTTSPYVVELLYTGDWQTSELRAVG